MIPLVTEADVQAVGAQMRSMWIGRGARVQELERVMAEWVGVEHAVAVGSGTAALVVALSAFPGWYASHPEDCCEAVKAAVRLAERWYRPGKGPRIAIYPDQDGEIVDFARCLPRRGEVTLQARFGVFSFGALKDVSGGLGGCVVANESIEVGEIARLSPISDINAAMVLTQLSRYQGQDERLVAGGKTWRMPCASA